MKLARAGGQRILTPRLGVPFEPALVETVDPWWREVVPAEAPARDEAASPA